MMPIPLDLGIENIRLHVLSPLDLAVSKIAYFADNDKKRTSPHWSYLA